MEQILQELTKSPLIAFTILLLTVISVSVACPGGTYSEQLLTTPKKSK